MGARKCVRTRLVKKKKSVEEVQREIREPTQSKSQAPQFDLKKLLVRAGVVLAVAWTIALFIPSRWPKIGAGVITLVAAGGIVWLMRYVKKTQAIGAILREADTD